MEGLKLKREPLNLILVEFTKEIVDNKFDLNASKKFKLFFNKNGPGT
jgi:hypothetical protein